MSQQPAASRRSPHTPLRLRRLSAGCWLLAACSSAAACGSPKDRTPNDSGAAATARAAEPPRPDSLVDSAVAPALGVDLAKMQRQPGGLYVQDLRRGTGAAADSGKTVTVHYTGWLTNGTKFDSSRDRKQPLDFPLGQGRVIQGWDRGLIGMRVGGRRRLVVPPSLGYGAAGQPGAIPSRATLVFDVELLNVR